MNRLTSTERIENGEDKLDSFGYDFSSQLVAANYGWQKVNGNWVNPQRPVSYTWDKAGNRDHIVDAGATTNYTTTNLNQYTVAGVDAVYNGSEHAISNYQQKDYGYVNDERLASIASANDTYQLAYDALGRCVKRTLNGVITYYVYDGEKPILEYNNVYQRVAMNLYGKAIDEVLMRTDYTVTPNLTFYYQDDHEGSVTHLTDASGAVIESYRYDAFGAPTIRNAANSQIPSSNFGNRFMFTGREYAQKFGIYEYRNRAYHPGLGRFTSEDPMGFAAGDNNLFRYCGNDPIDRVDPMGLFDDGYVHLSSAEEHLLAQARIEVAKSLTAKPTYSKELGRLVRLSTMQGVLRRDHGKEIKLSPVAEGRIQRGEVVGGIQRWVQTETIVVEKSWHVVAVTHYHLNKTGVGEGTWSGFDQKLAFRAIVERADEKRPNVWKRLVPRTDGTGYKEETVGSAAGSQNTWTSSSGGNLSNLTAAQLDALHQSLGVPSLAAEAVNFAPGRP